MSSTNIACRPGRGTKTTEASIDAPAQGSGPPRVPPRHRDRSNDERSRLPAPQPAGRRPRRLPAPQGGVRKDSDRPSRCPSTPRSPAPRQSLAWRRDGRSMAEAEGAGISFCVALRRPPSKSPSGGAPPSPPSPPVSGCRPAEPVAVAHGGKLCRPLVEAEGVAGALRDQEAQHQRIDDVLVEEKVGGVADIGKIH